MSVEYIEAVYNHSKATGGARLVLLALADFANEQGICWPSKATIAAKSGLSLHWVKVCLRRLKESGELEIHKPGGTEGRANHYRVALPTRGGNRLTPRGGNGLTRGGVTELPPNRHITTIHRGDSHTLPVSSRRETVKVTVNAAATAAVSLARATVRSRTRPQANNQAVDMFLAKLEANYPLLGTPEERRVWAAIGHQLTRMDPARARKIASALLRLARAFGAKHAPPAMLMQAAKDLIGGAA